MSEMMRVVGENEVVISLDEYVELIQDSQSLDWLINGLMDTARLSWNKASLSFSDDDACLILKTVAYRQYDYKLKSLLKELEESNGNDDGTDND